MRKLINKYFELNTWIVFAAIVVIYAIALTIEFKFVFTNEFYKNSLHLNNQYDFEKLVGSYRNWDWLNYPAIAIIVLFPTILISFCLNLGSILNGYNLKFSSIFKITIKSQIIFALNYLFAILLKTFGVINQNISNINNNYEFQSLLVFCKHYKLPYWLYYPFQNINLTEFIHILLLTFGIQLISQLKYLKSLSFVFIFYGIGLIIWIIFTVFLQTIMYF